jgi:hypothetical protein
MKNVWLIYIRPLANVNINWSLMPLENLLVQGALISAQAIVLALNICHALIKSAKAPAIPNLALQANPAMF